MTHVALAPPTAERRQAMTFEQFLAEVPEDVRAEWVDGEVIFFMPTDIRHQRIGQWLAELLGTFVRLFSLGEVLGMQTGMRTVPGRAFREPDLLFIGPERASRLTEKWVEGGADLVVELISDDSVRRDRVEKLVEYAAVGIPEYWVFDTRKGMERADFYQLGPSGTYQAQPLDAAGRYHSRVLPGFWLDPSWLWQSPLPDPSRLMADIAPDDWRDPVVRRT